MKLSSKKIIFLGTPKFAATALERLIAEGFDIIAVICQPDKKSGRGQDLSEPETKVVAKTYGLPVFQPSSKEELTRVVAELQPDLGIVAAYGKIIPDEALTIPKFGFINIHGSLLPKYRGGSCIPQAIINGDSHTGISIMKVVSEMDAGPVISQREVAINDNDTTATLTEKLSKIGAEEIVKAVPIWTEGLARPKEQESEKVLSCKLIRKEDARIDWSESATVISRKIRAYYPWPIAFTEIKGKKLQILHAFESDKELKPGLVYCTKNELVIGTGKGSLELIKVKPEGKRAMDIKDFLNGGYIEPGESLCLD